MTTPTSNLRNIFRYVNSRNRHEGGQMIQADNPYTWSNGSDMSNEDFYRANTQPGNDSSFTRNRVWNGQDFVDQWDINKGSFLDTVNSQYGANARLENGNLQMDYSKLPKSRLGPVDRLTPISGDHELRNLKNPKLVYDDPVYGKVTRLENWRSNNEYLGPALMAAMSAGMGAIMAPVGGMAAANAWRTGSSLVGLGRSLGSGNFNPASLAGMALGHVPGMQGLQGQLARMALTQGINRMRGGRG